MPRGEVLEDLIDAHILEQELLPESDDRLEQLWRNANDAFLDTKPESLVTIPIAAAQEPRGYITRMLEQLALQVQTPGVRPFSVALSANYPESDQEHHALNRLQTLDAISEFRDSAAGQVLPLSYFEQQYDPGTTIGKIRRDLSNVAMRYLRAQHIGGHIPQEAGLLIADIDTWKLSPQYISGQQARLHEGYSWSSANKRYLTTMGTFPNIDRAICALNLVQAINPHASYDCHALYSLESFIKGEGFSGNDEIAETHEMRYRAEKAMGRHFTMPFPRRAPGALAFSYPRRPIEKFRAGFAPYEFWIGHAFTMLDSYREGRTTQPDEDIDDAWMRYLVADQINNIVGRSRDHLTQGFLDENGDMTYNIARHIIDPHIANILRKADVILDLQLDKLSIIDTIARPSRQNGEIQL